MKQVPYYQPKYKNLMINTCKARGYGVYTSILKRTYEQLSALLSHYSRVSVLRFDLHFPEANVNCAKLENETVARFLRQLKQKLSTEQWGSHKRIIHGCVREVGKNQRGHYHLFIGIQAIYRRLGAVSSEGLTGLWALIQTCWSEASGGSMSVCKGHTVERQNEASINKCFYHLSYLAKVRDKHFGTGDTTKRFFFSRLQTKDARFCLSA